MVRVFFITDLHITTSCSSRVDDPLKTVIRKLEWCADYCNCREAALVLGGDVFDTPTVTFEAYNAVVGVLRKFRFGVYAVWGNHDMLYRTSDNNHKCSLYSLFDSGVVRELRSDTDIVLGSCLSLTTRLPLRACPIPQVLVYHGFLEQRDGVFSVSLADLLSCDGKENTTMVLLGHDHTKYADLVLDNGVIVVRPGSFFRNRRDESCHRQVYGVLVESSGARLSHTLVEVPAGTPDEVFAVKTTKEELGSSDSISYDALLSSLRSSTGFQDMTFTEALSAVAGSDVVEYCSGLLSSSNVKKIK